jgi:hypothetical protein
MSRGKSKTTEIETRHSVDKNGDTIIKQVAVPKVTPKTPKAEPRFGANHNKSFTDK